MNMAHRWLCRSARWKQTLEMQVMPWALKGVELGSNVLEVGPGPGLTTDILPQRVTHLTCVEIDRALVDSLSVRMGPRIVAAGPVELALVTTQNLQCVRRFSTQRIDHAHNTETRH
jgi:hypothetical protein